MYSFDWQTAVNELATLELTVSGITTAYGAGLNPTEIENPEGILPAVVHIVEGPQAAPKQTSGLRASEQVFFHTFAIRSRYLLVEASQENAMAAQTHAAGFWQAIANVFFNNLSGVDTRVDLCEAVGAEAYQCEWVQEQRTYPFDYRSWPDVTVPNINERMYLSYELRHIFHLATEQ